MKKLYIMLGYKGGISGGQIYVRNKLNHMKSIGYDVTVIDNLRKQKVLIEDLLKFKNNTLPELRFFPSVYDSHKREKILKKLIKLSGFNNSYDEVVIESATINFSMWGELLAKKINAKHMALLIDTGFPKDMKTDDIMSYLDFKLKRGELATISKKAFLNLFNGYRDIEENEIKFLSFSCSNSVEDIKYKKVIKKSDYDFVIGSLGRVSKPYFPDMVDAVTEFAKKHSDKKILFLVIGGKANGDNSVVTKKTKEIKNLDTHITGLMYPVPKELFDLMDVCIASSGSVRASYLTGAKTIIMDDETKVALGVAGYSVKKFPYIENQAFFGSLVTLLEEVLVNGYCENFEFEKLDFLEDYDIKEKLDCHVKLIESSNSEKEYYNVLDIKSFKNLSQLEMFLILTIGNTGLNYIRKIGKKVFKSWTKA